MNYCTRIPQAVIPSVKRMIVIGDVHGDWGALKSALKVARITNHHNEWIGGDTHVIQVGDLIDRKVRGGVGDEKSEQKILNHLIHLKQSALRAGGNVHLLLGNHELMNVMGDFRYVSPLGMTDFNGKRKQAFKPGGRIAKLMACNMNSVVQIGSWVFSHAGITSHVSKTYTIDQVNKHIRQFLLGNTVMNRDHDLMDIFWHRNYGHEGACPLVQDSLSHWKAKNMAVGHTVQEHGINSLCNGSFWQVDVGMSDAFGTETNSRVSTVEVLEILNDGDEINILKGKKLVLN